MSENSELPTPSHWKRCFTDNKDEWIKLYVDSTMMFVNLFELDKRLRLFVPALFSRIKIVEDKIIVEVPHQVVSRVVEHSQNRNQTSDLFDNDYLEVVGT